MIKRSVLNAVAVTKKGAVEVDGFHAKLKSAKTLGICIVDARPEQGRNNIKLNLTLREEATPVKT